MLLQLSIKDFAIFTDTTIDIKKGFNVITGESGSGKSIFVSALSLINGERAYKEYIRKGSECAVVEAVFNVHEDVLQLINEETDLGLADNMLVITREIYSETASVCKINGKIRSLQSLRLLSRYLCDIHGQYENQTLLDPNTHISILDELYDKKISTVKSEYSNMLSEYNKLVQFIIKNSGTDKERISRRDLLSYQIDEIIQSGVESFDMDNIKQQIEYLSNVEKYKNHLAESLNDFHDGDLIEQLYTAANHLTKIKEEEITQYSKIIMDSYFALKDVFANIKDIYYEYNFDEQLYNTLVQKQELFKKLSYKYGATIDEITNFREDAERQLYEIDNFEKIFQKSLEDLSILSDNLMKVGKKLDAVRKECAKEFEREVISNLSSLEMPSAKFIVNFNEQVNTNQISYPDYPQKGLSDIEFYISVNKGIDPLPLAKIASGGEISRIMLAIKSLISSKDIVDTYIFDEIDSGISGQAAIVTAEKLYKISLIKQIICISHLPQIAAKADNHYLIYKHDNDSDITHADIKYLDHEQRVEQIATLFEGKSLSKQAISHARILLEKMKNNN